MEVLQYFSRHPRPYSGREHAIFIPFQSGVDHDDDDGDDGGGKKR